MNRSEDLGPDDTSENPQLVLKECLDRFKTPDYIMEPGIFTQLKRSAPYTFIKSPFEEGTRKRVVLFPLGTFKREAIQKPS